MIRIPNQCAHNPNCRSKVLFYPTIYCWPKNCDHILTEPFSADIGLGFCSLHKDEFKIQDLPTIRKVISDLAPLKGCQDPDVDNMTHMMNPIIT